MGLFGLTACRSSPQQNPDHINWADSAVDRAYDMMDRGNPRGALLYLDSLFDVTPGRGIADVWRKYRAKNNVYANYLHDPAARERSVDSMFALLKGREKQYKFEYAHSLYERGNQLKAEKKYTQAFQSYYDGRLFAEKNLDSCSLSDFSNALGIIRYQQEEYAKAILLLRKALEECNGCRAGPDFTYGFVMPQSILNTIALCYEKTSQPDSALVFYNLALDFITERGRQYPERQVFVNTARGVVEGNLGGVYARLNDFGNAELHLTRGIAINDRPGYAIEDAQTTRIKLADLYLSHGHLRDADTILTRLHGDLEAGRGKSIANSDVWEEWYRLKWIYYDKAGRPEQALPYVKTYYTYLDSLDAVNDQLRKADMDQTFKEHEQQFQLNLLRENDKVKTAYLVTAGVFLLMAIALLGVIIRSLKQSGRHISELTVVNRQLNDAVSDLKQSRDENSRMMKIVAHDLRNPFGAMSSAAGLLLDDPARPEKDRAMLGLIKTSGEHSLALLEELLQANHQSSDLRKEPVELADLLKESLDLLRHKAEMKKQKIELQLEPVTLSLNREKVWRVMSNLLGNAIKFSPAGGSIFLKLEQAGQLARITVRDQGIGIPEEIRGKVFDMFTAAKRKGTSGEPSHGLGLAISRQIVEAHGGRIWFESRVGEGTTFFVELPADGS